MTSSRIFSKQWFRQLGSVKVTEVDVTTIASTKTASLVQSYSDEITGIIDYLIQEDILWPEYIEEQFFVDNVSISIDGFYVDITVPIDVDMQNPYGSFTVALNHDIVAYPVNDVITTNVYVRVPSDQDIPLEYYPFYYLSLGMFYYTGKNDIPYSGFIEIGMSHNDWDDVPYVPGKMVVSPWSSIRMYSFENGAPVGDVHTWGNNAWVDTVYVIPGDLLCVNMSLDLNARTNTVTIIGMVDGAETVFGSFYVDLPEEIFTQLSSVSKLVSSVEMSLEMSYPEDIELPYNARTKMEIVMEPEYKFTGYPAYSYESSSQQMLNKEVVDIRNRMVKLTASFTDVSGNVYPAGSYVIVNEEGEIKGTIKTRKQILDLTGE